VAFLFLSVRLEMDPDSRSVGFISRLSSVFHNVVNVSGITSRLLTLEEGNFLVSRCFLSATSAMCWLTDPSSNDVVVGCCGDPPPPSAVTSSPAGWLAVATGGSRCSFDLTSGGATATLMLMTGRPSTLSIVRKFGQARDAREWLGDDSTSDELNLLLEVYPDTAAPGGTGHLHARSTCTYSIPEAHPHPLFIAATAPSAPRSRAPAPGSTSSQVFGSGGALSGAARPALRGAAAASASSNYSSLSSSVPRSVSGGTADDVILVEAGSCGVVELDITHLDTPMPPPSNTRRVDGSMTTGGALRAGPSAPKPTPTTSITPPSRGRGLPPSSSFKTPPSSLSLKRRRAGTDGTALNPVSTGPEPMDGTFSRGGLRESFASSVSIWKFESEEQAREDQMIKAAAANKTHDCAVVLDHTLSFFSKPRATTKSGSSLGTAEASEPAPEDASSLTAAQDARAAAFALEVTAVHSGEPMPVLGRMLSVAPITAGMCTVAFPVDA